MPNASFRGCLIFSSRSLCTVVGIEFGNVEAEIDDRIATISLENYDSGSLWAKCINPDAIRADVNI